MIQNKIKQNNKEYKYILVEKPAEAGVAPLGAMLKLCEGDTRIRCIRRAITIIDRETVSYIYIYVYIFF